MSSACFFDDFEPGRVFDAGRRQITMDDIRAFADVSGDRSPLHVPDAGAPPSPFGGPVAHGALGIAVATGLLQQSKLTAASLIALIGLEWTFRAPVRPDDTVALRLQVIDRRVSRDPDRGIVRFHAVLSNQAGEVVQEGVLTELIRRRPA